MSTKATRNGTLGAMPFPPNGGGGLTKREHLAALVMQGLCSRADPNYESGPANMVLAKRAISMADALLMALEGAE